MRPTAKLALCSLALLSSLLLGCAHTLTQAPRSRGVVVTMTRLTVKPTPDNNPGARWDQGRQESNDDEGCGLLAALDLFAPGVGTVASVVCTLGASSSGDQHKAEDPDLFVAFEVGAATYTSPVIADRPSHDLRYSLFIPMPALRDNRLRVAVYDLDGEDRRHSTLIADHEFTAAQLDAKLEVRGQTLGEPSLEVLRLEIGEAAGPQHVNRTMSVDAGLVAIDELDIPAGMLVEIRATGSYMIGSSYDATLGPDGYPGGGPREYNLPGNDDLRGAKHGAAVALLHKDSAAQAIVVGECVRFIARSGGRMFVGVNDRDYSNNRGSLSFDIHVTPPDAQTWARGDVQTCQ